MTMESDNETALAKRHPERRQLADLRSMAMLATPEQMQAALSQYAESRQTFRVWLQNQMQLGTHYGYPPGCEPPNTRMRGGVMEFEQKSYNRQKKEWFSKWVPCESWKHKPSLYKAGAELVVDLMGLRSEYNSDLPAWEQMGKPKDTFVRRCRLYSRSTGELIGEGTGARVVGTKGGDVNNAIKMADKCAMVCAVLNSYGLSDLFSQDLEDMASGKESTVSPVGSQSSPGAVPRGERVTSADLKKLYSRWESEVGEFGEEDKPTAFRKFVHKSCGLPMDDSIKDAKSWTKSHVDRCHAAIDEWLGVPADISAPHQGESNA